MIVSFFNDSEYVDTSPMAGFDLAMVCSLLEWFVNTRSRHEMICKWYSFLSDIELVNIVHFDYMIRIVPIFPMIRTL